jgi:hypothetical protein
MVLYKAVQPWQVRPGNRVNHLGLRTVVSVRPCDEEIGCYITFSDGSEGLFVNDLSVVDESRSRAIMERYTGLQFRKRRVG